MEILENEQKVYDKLDELAIEYTVIEHEPVYTAAELDSIKDRTHGIHCKNLFLIGFLISVNGRTRIA